MFGFICKSCQQYIRDFSPRCPYCQSLFICSGNAKNIIDTFVPNCLIHRYPGSDLLEPALFLKAGKINLKVAIKLKDIAKPITVPKQQVFCLDETIFAAITALRAERHATMQHYDELIGKHWHNLQAYETCPVSRNFSYCNNSPTVTNA